LGWASGFLTLAAVLAYERGSFLSMPLPVTALGTGAALTAVTSLLAGMKR